MTGAVLSRTPGRLPTEVMNLQPPELSIGKVHLEPPLVPSRCGPSSNAFVQDEMVVYNNALITLSQDARPDPFVIQAPNGRLYLTFTANNRIEILSADNLYQFRYRAKLTTVWRPPPNTEYSAQLWAPELHALNGRWYIYFAADDPKRGNISHRMYVLGGSSANDDPTTGEWEFLGSLQGLPCEQWAIDGTVFLLSGEMYFCYSGWPVGELYSDLIQELWILRLDTPTQTSGEPIMICKPELEFEFTRDARGLHGINEGPQWLESPDGTWSGFVYSCAGSWTHEYKMNTLQLVGNDPLDPASWRKSTTPLLQNRSDMFGPFAPGHGNFLDLQGRTLAIFHATDEPTDGWSKRKPRCQEVGWNSTGPFMGGCVGVLTDAVDAFTKWAPLLEAPQTLPDDDN